MIVSIVGAGHSGSTLLDLLVSSHPAVTSLGEVKLLVQWARRATREPGTVPCTCGVTPFTSCDFWRDVEASLAHHGGPKALVDLRLTADTGPIGDDLALFRAAAEVAGASAVVDSSKQPGRMLGLHNSGQLDIRPVLLTRHIAATGWSAQKRGKSFWRRARRAAAANVRARVAVREIRHFELRYEDLATDPAGRLSDLMAWMGLELEPSQLDYRASAHHNVGGNNMRLATSSAITLDDEWRRRLRGPRRVGAVALELATRLPDPVLTGVVALGARVGRATPPR